MGTTGKIITECNIWNNFKDKKIAVMIFVN